MTNRSDSGAAGVVWARPEAARLRLRHDPHFPGSLSCSHVSQTPGAGPACVVLLPERGEGRTLVSGFADLRRRDAQKALASLMSSRMRARTTSRCLAWAASFMRRHRPTNAIRRFLWTRTCPGRAWYLPTAGAPGVHGRRPDSRHPESVLHGDRPGHRRRGDQVRVHAAARQLRWVGRP